MINIRIVYVLPSMWRSASAVIVGWRTRRAGDDDWLGNEPRGIEDDKLFNSGMTDDRTTQTEDDLRASSRATCFAC